MIATLDISKPRDEHGRVIEPNLKFDNELVRYVASTYYIFSHIDSISPRIPNPFKINIAPRSEQAANLVMETEL